MENGYAERLAELLVGFGANVQPDQIVSVACEPGKETYSRAIAAAAYRHGARFVDIAWFDPWVKRARIEHAREETLGFVPPWYGERMKALGEHRAARIGLAGPDRPGPARRPRPRAHRARPAADDQGGRHAGVRAHDQLDDRAVPDAGLGRARLPGPRAGRGARAAHAAARARAAARRGRPARRLARARRHARRRRAAAERAPLRRDPLRRPGHRPDGRAAAERPLAGGALHHRRRHRAHAQPARPRRSSRRPTRSGRTAT